MPLLSDVGTYVAANGGGSVGTTIFEGQVPDDMNAGIGLFEYPGAPPDYSLDDPGVHIEKPRFQVYCRHTDYTTGRALIETVYEALAKVVNQALSGTTYLRIEPLGSPFQLTPPRDGQGRWEWRCNFTTEKALG